MRPELKYSPFINALISAPITFVLVSCSFRSRLVENHGRPQNTSSPRSRVKPEEFLACNDDILLGEVPDCADDLPFFTPNVCIYLIGHRSLHVDQNTGQGVPELRPRPIPSRYAGSYVLYFRICSALSEGDLGCIRDLAKGEDRGVPVLARRFEPFALQNRERCCR
ncbi:hypothetical protein DFH07DRAFT_802717 [Mycena maculata]|uniref:Uncharacterized protein n=1 Tax=Mycena maculata TaxID=230809 RepID=A0AAD7JXQ0_9AGAR|nr:hypothetical protein DFH07DRAFT_802717 [Mycena maculata]